MKKGDFLLSWSATLDTFIWNGPNAILNQHIFNVKPKNGNSLRFAYYLISFEIENLKQKTHGTGMKHITKRDLDRVEILLPNQKEQERIADIMTVFDKEISLLRTKLSAFKSCKLALMQKLLTGKIRVKV